MARPLIIIFILLLAPLKVWAAIDSFDFSSDEKREQYQVLVEELRCPKCKNNNLAGSNSMIAVDLKREIHTMVEAGDTSDKIVEFMVTRYGDFVLYRPRMRKETLLLWSAPVAMLVLGLAIVGSIVWRRSRATNLKDALSPEEQARLAAVLTQGANMPPTPTSTLSNNK